MIPGNIHTGIPNAKKVKDCRKSHTSVTLDSNPPPAHQQIPFAVHLNGPYSINNSNLKAKLTRLFEDNHAFITN